MTRAMFDGLLFAVALYAAAFAGVFIARAACYVCGAEPVPGPRVYLPAVMTAPRMTSEHADAVPVATVTPEVQP